LPKRTGRHPRRSRARLRLATSNMYYYVYDEFVQDPKFERELSLVETRLTDLGIAGKIARLALFRDPRELIRDEIRKGVKTIIAVGNDHTLRTIVEAATGQAVVLGIIPFAKENNSMALMLGMPSGAAACDVLSARIVADLDAGEISGNRFLHTVKFAMGTDTRINCDGNYTLEPYRDCEVEVRNMALPAADARQANPIDGKLELVVRVPERKLFGKKKNTTSVIFGKRFILESESEFLAQVDGKELKGKRFDCRVIPGQVKMITGKGRMFL